MFLKQNIYYNLIKLNLIVLVLLLSFLKVFNVFAHKNGHDHIDDVCENNKVQSQNANNKNLNYQNHSNLSGIIEEKVQVEEVLDVVYANGIIDFHPQGYAKVTSLISGRVKEIKVKLGDYVKKGQELLVLESIDVFNAKTEYLRNLSRYEVLLSKYDNIIKIGVLGTYTDKVFEETQNILAEAKANYEKLLSSYEIILKKYERIKKLANLGIVPYSELESVELERKNLAIELNSAKLKFENAKSALMREHKLTDEKLLFKKEVLDIQNELNEARQNYEISKHYLEIIGVECEPNGNCREHNLGTFSIYSPIDGVIVKQDVALGSTVDNQTPLMCIGNYDLLVVNIDVYENDFHKLKLNQEVIIGDMDYQKAKGRIINISKMLDATSRTVKVCAEIEKNIGNLKINEYVNCFIILNKKEKAIIIPQSAIIDDMGQKFVFVRCKDKYEKREVKIGVKFNNKVEIVSGLKSDDIVVTSGNLQLFHSMRSSNVLELNCESCK